MNTEQAIALSSEEYGPLNPSPSVARPLGAMERTMWLLDQASPTNICVGCDIQGEVKDNQLREALLWCRKRYPLLRSIIRKTSGRLYFHCYDNSDAPEIPLDICMGKPEEEDQIATQEMRQPLHGLDGLMIRVKLVRFTDNHSFLCMVFNHVIGDGTSGVMLLKDTIDLLGLQSEHQPLPEVESLEFPPAVEQTITADHRGFKGLRKFFAFQKEIFGEIRTLGAQPRGIRIQDKLPFDERRVKINSFTLDAAETRAIIALAKKEKVTLYALLSAILLDALYPLLESDPKANGTTECVASIAAPVDLRPFLSAGVKEHFGFYSSAISGLYKLSEANDIPTLAKQLQGSIKKRLFRDKVQLHTNPVLSRLFSTNWLFPVSEKGITRLAKITDGMFKANATSMTYINNRPDARKTGNITTSRARGHISPSIMGSAIYCVILNDNQLTVYLNYNETQFKDADAELLNERFKNKAIEMANTEVVSETQ